MCMTWPVSLSVTSCGRVGLLLPQMTRWVPWLLISFLPGKGWFYMDFWLESLSNIYLTSHTFSVGVEDTNAQGLGACSSGKGFLCVRFSACFLFHFSHSRLKQSCTAFWKLKSIGWLNIRQKALIFMYALSAHLGIFHSTLAHPVHAQASAWLQSRSCSCWNQWGVTTRDRIHWLRIAHKFMKFWELPAVSH